MSQNVLNETRNEDYRLMNTEETTNATGEETTEENTDFAAALEGNLEVTMPEKGKMITGTIIKIDDDITLVNCGAKSEAVLESAELDGQKVGDKIEALVLETEPTLKITLKLDNSDASREVLQQAFESGIAVTGTISKTIKGGFLVDISGNTAFLPISQLDLEYVQDTSSFLGKSFEFKIIEFDQQENRFKVSRAEILKKQLQEKAEQTWANLKVGEIVDGKVSSFQDFGAFIDIGGIEGLLHISELSLEYTTHPSEVLEIGQEVKVKILNADREKNRISLSMKQLANNPWEDHAEDLQSGKPFSGEIVRKTDFGLFVQLYPGIDGLLHVSQLRPGTSLDDEEYAIGKKLEGWIRSVDVERKRAGLTLHEIPGEDPWKHIPEKYKIGTTIDGTVEEATRFGVFVLLEPGVTGLMPMSELRRAGVKNPEQEYQPQTPLRVTVTAIDEERKRISLLPEDKAAAASSEAPAKKNAGAGKKKKGAPRQKQQSKSEGGVSEFGALLAAALKTKKK